MSRRQLVPFNVFCRQADPLPPLFPQPNEGDVYFNTFRGILRVYFGGQWRDSAAGTDELDPIYINASGDTMTGPLTLAGPPTTALMAATKAYVDTAAPNEVAVTGVQPTDPNVELWVDPNGTWASEYATKAYVDGPGWTNVTFQNGWVNYGAPFNPARYTKVGPVVYMAGLVASGTIGATIFTLPSGYRPTQQLIFVVQSNGLGRMDITTSGAVNSTNGSNAWFSVCCSFLVI